MANEITVTVADAALPEIWEKEALRALYEKRLVAKPDVVLFKVVEGKPGDNIDFTELGALTVAGVGSDGAANTNTAMTHTQRQIALSNWRGTNISVPNRTLVQSVLSYDKEFAVAAGGALGQDMDDSILDDHGSITTNVEGSTTTPGIMTDALLRAAILDLEALAVPAEKRTFILHPKARFEILGDENFKNAYATGSDKGIQVSGLMLPLYGIKMVVSSRVVSTGTPAVRKNLLIQEQCLGFALQKDITITKHDRVGDYSVRWLAEYLSGDAVLRNNHGVVINTAA